MRIATWNVNSLRVRLDHLRQWLAASPVHAIGLQELKLPDEQFPRAEVEALGLQAAHYGQKTYNGVAILARRPLTEVVTGIPGDEDPQRRVIAATVGGIRVVNVYVPNGQTVDSEKYLYKLAWLERLTAYLGALLKQHEQLLVMGDFNIAPEDRDVHDPAQWEGSVHVSAPERAALSKIAALGFTDLFRRFEQPEKSFSWWDYRMGAFRRNRGLRIDYLFANAAVTKGLNSATIDKTPRTWEKPSDHAPVVIEFDN
jgi:exodeoxyribonuclease-3